MAPGPARSDPLRWHLVLVLAVAVGWEALFFRQGLSLIDEGWPLYAAMRLQDGGTLYRDVFFVFPPLHALPASIAWALAPPGIALSRAIYSAFAVALCAVLYLLGRRIMPPGFALLGALLVAVAAPHSHLAHHLFGYRYLVWSALALLAFDARLRTGERRWMLAAGALIGLAFCTRLTPAFAAACALVVGALAAGGGARAIALDLARVALGVLLVAGPVYGWIAAGVGIDAVWREVVVRPVAMTDLQSLPVPPIVWSDFSRDGLTQWFAAVQFRAWGLLYLVYAGVLLAGWARSRAPGRRFEPVLLLTVVVWGGVYFARTLGRSDRDHLESALPPVCLLLAHALWLAWRRATRIRALSPVVRQGAFAAVSAAVLGVWLLLSGAGAAFPDRATLVPLRSAGGAILMDRPAWARAIDARVAALRDASATDQTILDLSFSPLFYVLSGRLGPGWHDTVMPGTFLDPSEEAAFVARLERAPPAAVLWPSTRFDDRDDRTLQATAPRLLRWVGRSYEYVDGPRLAVARRKP